MKRIFALLISALVLVPATPAGAHGSGPEYLYEGSDAYLTQRVQEVTDTSDVLVAVRVRPTVSGWITGIRICLDLSQLEVNPRLPLLGNVWTDDGTLLGTAGASEGIVDTPPCFYNLTGVGVHVNADQYYVVGFWLRGGQYSYVPHGFDSERSSGHLVAVGSLYTYTSRFGMDSPFPTDSWENADYLVSPRFLPDPH